MDTLPSILSSVVNEGTAPAAGSPLSVISTTGFVLEVKPARLLLLRSLPMIVMEEMGERRERGSLKMKRDKIFRVDGRQATSGTRPGQTLPVSESSAGLGEDVGVMGMGMGMEIVRDKGWRDAMPDCVTRALRGDKEGGRRGATASCN